MRVFFAILVCMTFLCSCETTGLEKECTVTSPNNSIKVSFALNETGQAGYHVEYAGNPVVFPSGMSFEFTDQPPLDGGLEILDVKYASADSSWELPWGEKRKVNDQHNEMLIKLAESGEPGRQVDIRFRVFDDGVGFRYEFPEQVDWDTAFIKEENTEFRLTDNHRVWWTPGDWDIYEHLYNDTRFSEIDALSKRNEPLAQTYIHENAVNTPVTMKTAAGLYLAFHEAALLDYSGITLKVNPTEQSMVSSLVGGRADHKVELALPFKTPWRTILISENATGLVESDMILNLNEPNRLGDVSWIKPLKYVGIWWSLHLGKESWDIASGKHGATTGNAKKHIDFAAENNIGGVLFEGWNTGWEPDEPFDFITPYPDYDLEEVVRYGKEKGVELIMHHETFSNVPVYEQQLDTAFRLMHRLGIGTVKTGYVTALKPEGEYHHGQWMVRHHQRVLEAAAKYQIAVNAHEPIMATGTRRTYPNAISREGVRGQEFNVYDPSGSLRTDHLTVVPFTRMLAGPIDYTPGIFNLSMNPYKPNNRVSTTITHQLALFVIIYNPIQMAADLIEYYEDNPAFQFIRDVGVDWEESKVLDGEIGDFITMARKERDTHDWFVGSLTDENEREISIALDFLEEGKTYKATIYKDAETTHWDTNPTEVVIETTELTHEDLLNIRLAPGGGLAISFERQ
ncbi:MAG: glycoside hydrolase family 97 protein [Bacteroidota bacterium]